jgi:hypothetical protein
MAYRHGHKDLLYSYGITEAEFAEGYRLVNIPTGWLASSSNGAATGNFAMGNSFNTNAKFFSFADSAAKYIVSGEGLPFVGLPDDTISSARLKVMWGQRGQPVGDPTLNVVTWNFQAIQTEDADLIIDNNDANVINVAMTTHVDEPAARYAYKISAFDLPLTSFAANRPTMFTLGRKGANGSDTLGVAAIVYSIALLIK